ncbi:hypothetical protein Q7P37_001541 [Cladosporium fusiforme]
MSNNATATSPKKQAEDFSDTKKFGKWEEPFSIENVACHATLLPNSKILCWSRRSNPMSPTDSMNEQKTNAFLIDWKAKGTMDPDPNKADPRCKYTGNQPQSFGFVPSPPKPPKTLPDPRESDISLFCSGHCLLPDGNLFVVGGHKTDSHGIQQACIYDWKTDRWSAKEKPNVGRWYPSALTLPDSTVFTISGNMDNGDMAQISQIWRGDKWEAKLVPDPRVPLPIYPHLHLHPSGQIFMAGPNKETSFLDLNTVSASTIGAWGVNKLNRNGAFADFGASVTYDSGMVLWTGGGHGEEVTRPGFKDKIAGEPFKTTELINLNEKPEWKTSPEMDMKHRRRQHNLTTLPDGTVLVTGGTRGVGFNDLTAGQPVHHAELWDPRPGHQNWTEMAPESTDRGYHGVALLLPDGSVFSAGGGEGGEFDAPPNPPIHNPKRDNHTNAQIYKPPYFFISEPPQISGVPQEARYGIPFNVTVLKNDKISRASWIRLPSVTHTINSSQSVYFQPFSSVTGTFQVTPPENRNVATPGYYMLFFVKEDGRPSEAAMIKLLAERTDKENTLSKPIAGFKPSSKLSAQVPHSLAQLDEKVIKEQDRPAVKVGLTAVCPYGLGSCWAGAFEGLQGIEDVDVVRPLPDQANSVAYVYLKEDKLPDLDVWRKELAKTAGGAYDMRGIELTITGTVTEKLVDGKERLVLSGTTTRPEVLLEPFKATSKLERNHKARTLKPVSDHELSAYASLVAIAARHVEELRVKVTGRLHKHGEKEFCLDVKEFYVVDGVMEA